MMDGYKHCVSQLNEYAQQSGSVLSFQDLGCVGPDHDKVFSCRVVLDGEVYPDAVGRSKKKAKYNAAESALKCLLARTRVSDETRRQSVTSKDNNFPEKCATGTASQCSPKRSRDHTCEKRCHEPNNSHKEHPVSEDENVKKAKQNTSQLAWTAPQQHSDSKDSFGSTASEDDAAMSSQLTESTVLFSSEVSQSSESIVFTDSSNPLKAQVSPGSNVSESDASTSFESTEPSSQNMETGENCSGYMDISNPDKDQVAVKNNSMGNGESNESRFILEFDSISRLGKGGFGRVFKAREKLVNKYYAVKVVQFKKKALREVTALSDLHHRNIVRYFNCWKQDSDYQDDSSVESSTSSESVSHSSPMYLYIKMELCDTRTLESWIMERNEEHQQDSKRREESLNIAQQIVSGVEYIHSKKHIHRDLKPPNIMFGQNNEVKIVDFGLVTAEADGNDKHLMERTKRTGTISYMAPEQHGKTYDRKVDIFALGLIYLELLWKVSSGSERAAIFMDAKRKKFPTQFTSEFFQEHQIIKSMLHEKPGDRPEATALKTKLEKLSLMLSAQKDRSWRTVTDRTR
ncbi:interferon-induced, double-stranded RNA-activated protein kinase-like [Solea solea]|uniref:interferon-induced, double-stranded RNA-activated protein kinase-like n=1 Tax=Solea solea TaxID=90069 RepID=UPI00272C0D2C|nr:interferon-induced, double-stranded RNA-activated protein kinase-like [Solea solea]